MGDIGFGGGRYARGVFDLTVPRCVLEWATAGGEDGSDRAPGFFLSICPDSGETTAPGF